MKFLSLCSWIDAASVASKSLGWECVGFSEIEPFPCAVLAHRYPSVQNFGDMTRFAEWPEQVFIDADAIVGWPPCQAFSMAGKREWLDDARGNLTIIYANLIDHADRIRAAHGKSPVWCLYENVPGLLSDRTNAFGCLLGKLAGENVPLLPTGGKWTNAGAVFWPSRSIAWRVLDAQYFGVAQRRRRVFVVAGSGNFDPSKVLFESEGVRRNSAPSRETRKEVTDVVDTLSANGGGTTRPAGNANELDFCVATGFNARQDPDSWENRTGPIDTCWYTQGVATYRWQNNDAGIVPDDVAAIIKAKGTTTDERSIGAMVAPTKTCQYGDASWQDMLPWLIQTTNEWQVRRLTPTECERLQWFPDGYTAIPWKNKPAEECPDGPRYKSLGNSWAVPCAKWIFSRIG